MVFRRKNIGGNRPTFGSGTAGDVIRNIIGSFQIGSAWSGTTTGAFRFRGSDATGWGSGGGSSFGIYDFDPSIVVPTDTENAPRTLAVRYWRRVA